MAQFGFRRSQMQKASGSFISSVVSSITRDNFLSEITRFGITIEPQIAFGHISFNSETLHRKLLDASLQNVMQQPQRTPIMTLCLRNIGHVEFNESNISSF